MFQNILVPLDGSSFSEHALPYALSIAEKSGAVIHLVRVSLPTPGGMIDAPVDYRAALEESVAQHQQEELESTTADLVKRSGVMVIPTVLRPMTGVSEAIATHATEVEADLVVMTSHGRGGLSRVFLGSVADELIRMLPMPLLVVRPTSDKPDYSTLPTFKNILIPVDGTPEAEHMVRPAAAMAKIMHAKATLMRAIKPVLEPAYEPYMMKSITEEVRSLMARMEGMQEEVKAHAEKYLEQIASTMQQDDLEVEKHVVIQAQPGAAILEHAETDGADLIALETHGRKGFSRLLLGSVADKVIRGTHVPVMVHRCHS